MSYVASPEEISVFSKWSSKPEFSQEGIAVEFRTTEEFVKSVLPPGFEPAAEPKGSILLSSMESKLCGEFDCTLVTIDAIFKGITGKYCLEMLISGDTPVTWGREVWGETKKTGITRLYRSGNHRYAYAERNGVRLIEIEGEFGDDLPEEVLKGHQFEIKAYPNLKGTGMQWEPIVDTLEVTEHKTRQSLGKGSVTMRVTTANPLHTIPIKSVGQLEYVSGLAEHTVVGEDELGAGHSYLPYLIGRHYDDLREFKVGLQWISQRLAAKEREMVVERHFASA
ncbi:hypothetical protein KCU81_g9855, partial [Aureobasidium melanogenum]|uniref:Acetoacetate decarboxylase n=1 Tax=Aureobasidium melanogenum (strain CBS 110374) TaxID=1043003 RepID=A0A074W553_AURM1